MSEMTLGVSRRQVAKGSAWAIPVVSIAAAAPALAVSPPPPTLTSYTLFSQANVGGGVVSPYSCSGNQQFQVNGRASGGNFTVNNTVSGNAVTNISMTFWLAADAGTTWTAVAGSSTCWTLPVAGATMSYNGNTFRSYTTNFTCSAVATGSTYAVPSSQMFNWVSSCQVGASIEPGNYHYTQTATVRGVTITKDNGWSNVMV